MKLILLFFIIIPISLYSQNDEVDYYEYKLYITKEKTDQDKEVTDYVGMFRMDTITYELYINNKEGNYKAAPRLSNTQNEGLDFAEILINSYGSYYYDLKDSIIYNNREFNGKKISVKQPYNHINWQHLPEEEIINGIKCKKATFSKSEKSLDDKPNKQTTTIWYSDEINSNAMPFGFAGFSGGIVKINFNDFSEVILSKTDHYKQHKNVHKPKMGKVISAEDYKKMSDEYSKKIRESRSGGVDKD